MSKRFVISDLHLGHKNIIQFERNEFSSVEEHDAFIIKKWNSVVNDSDLVYVLGDVAFSLDLASLKEKLTLLKGTKILIKGNHDHKTNSFYKKSGFKEVYDGPLYIFKGRIILSHEPVREAFNNPFVINVYGHLHNEILSLPNFISVSAKTIAYKPLNLSLIEELALLKCKEKRKEPYKKEWYAPYVSKIC